MRKTVCVLGILFLVLVVSLGCASRTAISINPGVQYLSNLSPEERRARLDKLVEEKADERKVRLLFGNPILIEETDRGEKIYTYPYSNEEMEGKRDSGLFTIKKVFEVKRLRITLSPIQNPDNELEFRVTDAYVGRVEKPQKEPSVIRKGLQFAPFAIGIL